MENKLKLEKLDISKFIHTDFRDYAIYAVESRGIPSFSDFLTPGQRFIVQNTPTNFIKTNSVIGRCLEDNYHHGDAALAKTISTMTRPFLCSDKILEGDGFFGNSIKTEAAAPRYTFIKLSPTTKEIVSKYSDLNTREEEGNWHPLKMEIPLGLISSTKGVGVGYSCDILPRRLDHIKEYLEGKRKKIEPYLMNFNGKITKNTESEHKSSWKIEPLMTIDYLRKTISIKDISPTISQETYIKKINTSVLEKYNCSYVNDTNTAINIEIKFNKSMEVDELKEVYDKIYKFSTAIETENIVLIHNKSVLKYDLIEDYLDDFKNYREILWRDKLSYDIKVYNFNLDFINAKIEFLKFMLGKKRENQEIVDFLAKYSSDIQSKLDSIKLRNLNTNYLEETIDEKKKLEEIIVNSNKELNRRNLICKDIPNIIQKANVRKRNELNTNK